VGVRRGVQRLTLAEAAQLLGISKGAVRQRVRRRTLRSEKGEDGRVYVYVDSSAHDVHHRTAHDEDALVEELRDRIRYLERQVEEERNARYRADELLARLMDRAQLEAPQETTEATETVEDEAQEAQPRPDAPGAQEGVQRPWWRRVFGG
jgi:TolA-binding protein